MAEKKRYVFNQDTLAYELQKIPLFKRVSKGMLLFLLSFVAFIGYYLIYTKAFHFRTPKTIALQQDIESITSKLEVLQTHMEESWDQLDELQSRDNNVYRPVFGIEPIPAEVRNSGAVELSGDLRSAMDMLYEKAYIQSVSFDTIIPIANRVGQMAACVPAIPPVFLNHIRFTSRFGVRSDPMNGDAKVHTGLDMAGHKGEPIYVTGSGTVEEVSFNFFGYGNVIVVNHGFGYKTRYAHLQRVLVKQGDRVEKGEQIATMGTSGRSTGPHLHYEVVYMGRKMNPLNYFNSAISMEDYARMISDK